MIFKKYTGLVAKQQGSALQKRYTWVQFPPRPLESECARVAKSVHARHLK